MKIITSILFITKVKEIFHCTIKLVSSILALFSMLKTDITGKKLAYKLIVTKLY